jgi:hypothetical protein
MQRWEYCTLQRRACTPARWYLTVYRAKVPLDRVFRPGEAARERGLHDVWARTLARLGREGWELVAANGAGFHFKRPAPSHTAPILQTAVLGDGGTAGRVPGDAGGRTRRAGASTGRRAGGNSAGQDCVAARRPGRRLHRAGPEGLAGRLPRRCGGGARVRGAAGRAADGVRRGGRSAQPGAPAGPAGSGDRRVGSDVQITEALGQRPARTCAVHARYQRAGRVEHRHPAEWDIGGRTPRH